MIGFFPEIYPDELVYSWFARYYAASGYSAYIDAIRDLYENMVKPDIEFINRLNAQAREVITAMVPMDELILKHTMFPYYARFLPAERRRRAYGAIYNMDSNTYKLVNIPSNRKTAGKIRYVRYCPLCVSEDRERYGETYIHRNHQITNVDICSHHYCTLKSTEIPIIFKASRKLFVLDCMLDSTNRIDFGDTDSDIETSDSELGIKLAEYVTEIFQSDMLFDNTVDAGKYLHSKIVDAGYRSARGERINLSQFYADYSEYYSHMYRDRDIHKDDAIPDIKRIQAILSGQRWNTHEICQIAMFLGVEPYELMNMVLPEKSHEAIFDERAAKMF